MELTSAECFIMGSSELKLRGEGQKKSDESYSYKPHIYVWSGKTMKIGCDVDEFEGAIYHGYGFSTYFRSKFNRGVLFIKSERNS